MSSRSDATGLKQRKSKMKIKIKKRIKSKIKSKSKIREKLLAHFLSSPRSAWAREFATLCVAPRSQIGRDAERPDVRSHAERGNEGN